LSLQADDPVCARASAGVAEQPYRQNVHNAIAHSEERRAVGESVVTMPDGVEIAVEDDGPGFPEDQVARAGERFARGEQSRGSGLGLSIVRAIAALHGGSVTVSRSSAGGARVALHLPAAAIAGNAT
jgi:signal transduction histidine kinase